MYTLKQDVTPQIYNSFLTQCEGLKGITDPTDTKPNTSQFTSIKIDDTPHNTYLTELGEINGAQMVTILNDQSTLHMVTRKDPFDELAEAEPNEISAFTFDDCYSLNTFQGIMPDSDTVGVLTAGNPQFLALQKLDPTV
jgi:hypothetical protein